MANIILLDAKSAEKTYTGITALKVRGLDGIDKLFYDTSTANVTAEKIAMGKIAFDAEGPVTGTMTDNGSLSGVITALDGTYEIPKGYTEGGEVTLSLTPSETTAFTTTSENLIGINTNPENAIKVKVAIPTGYYEDCEYETKISNVIPTNANYAAAGNVIAGKMIYGTDGRAIQGTIPVINKGTVNYTEDGTYTLESGYYEAPTTIKVNCANKTLTGSEIFEVTMPRTAKVKITDANGGSWFVKIKSDGSGVESA